MAFRSENILAGPPLEDPIDLSLGELLLLALRTHNENILQIDSITGEQVPAYVLLNRAIALAKWLQRNGFGPGDNISISSENCLEYSVVPIATLLIGATIAPLNPQYTLGEATHVLSLSKPKLIFCSPKTIDKVLSGRQNYPFLTQFVVFGQTYNNHPDVIMYESIIKDAKVDSADETYQAHPVDPKETVAVILCSSGTTGMPKGVMITHFNITTNLQIAKIRASIDENVGEDEDIVMTGITPFFHGMGFIILLMTMLGGRKLVVFSKFDPKSFLESISKYKISVLAVPPPIVTFLLKYAAVINYDLSAMKEIAVGAAPLNKDLELETAKKFNIRKITQNYGMTETTLGVLLPWDGKHRFGSVGHIVPGMKCKVVDEKGNALGPNQEGELCFQGPLVMKGYINNPQATTDMIDDENWLHTGDIGYYDNDGFFFIVDRIKELIKYKGFQVAPVELEGVLMTHPAVADAAVIGLEDDEVGELPLAFVVKKSSEDITSSELENFIAERVSSAKWLRGGVHFIDEIPKTPSGKILRRVLRTRVKKQQSKL